MKKAIVGIAIVLMATSLFACAATPKTEPIGIYDNDQQTEAEDVEKVADGIELADGQALEVVQPQKGDTDAKDEDSNLIDTSKDKDIALVDPKTEEIYTYSGETDIDIDGRKFLLEEIPKSLAEETVTNNFLYTITADFESQTDILGDIIDQESFIRNQKEDFDLGVYIQSYTIYEIFTFSEIEYGLDRSEISGEDPVFYEGWQDVVQKYNLVEYEIVNLHFTQKHSDIANEFGPQWGDGRYYRSFIVGKTSSDKNYKIYDYGQMHESGVR